MTVSMSTLPINPIESNVETHFTFTEAQPSRVEQAHAGRDTMSEPYIADRRISRHSSQLAVAKVPERPDSAVGTTATPSPMPAYFASDPPSDDTFDSIKEEKRDRSPQRRQKSRSCFAIFLPCSRHDTPSFNIKDFDDVNPRKPRSKKTMRGLCQKKRSWAAVAGAILVIIVAVIVALKLTHHDTVPRVKLNTSKSSSPVLTPIQEVLSDNFPDPTVKYVNGTWYAFATNNAAGILTYIKPAQLEPNFGTSNIQLATSTDFKHWTLSNATQDPLPKVGAWAVQGTVGRGPVPTLLAANTWAPSVMQRPSDGKWIMYYSSMTTVADSKGGRPHCIGAAVGDSPAGPYVPEASTLACPVDIGGAIDPAAFVDYDDSVYVAYKVDGNSLGNGGSCGNTREPIQNTPIMLQAMQADGITPNGPAVTLLNRTNADGPLVEAPVIVRSHEGIYFLFFSSGCTRDDTYDIKYATATNITGPFTRALFPLMSTNDWGLLAPGSCDVVPNNSGGFAMVFHARVINQYGGVRAMFTSQLNLNNTRASVLAPMSSTHGSAVFLNGTLALNATRSLNATTAANQSSSWHSAHDNSSYEGLDDPDNMKKLKRELLKLYKSKR